MRVHMIEQQRNLAFSSLLLCNLNNVISSEQQKQIAILDEMGCVNRNTSSTASFRSSNQPKTNKKATIQIRKKEKKKKGK